MAQFDRGLAIRRIASSGSSSAKQGYLSSFSPHFCPNEAISGSSHRSVCILLESLPPPHALLAGRSDVQGREGMARSLGSWVYRSIYADDQVPYGLYNPKPSRKARPRAD